MKKNTSKVEVTVHGEAFFFPSKIPTDAVKRNTNPSDKYVIVADSETTGNHHVVDLNEGVTFFDKEGVTFMSVEKETSIRCLHPDRHDEVKIPAGTYEFGTQQEYDPFEARLRKVRD
jgi:hypothetical protein